MERLHKLLFELSNAERINILLEFQSRRMKLSNISRKLDLTVTETSRHLQRLGDARLVSKGADGLYGLTPYGEIALSQLSGLGFVEQHRDYFLEYDASCLPYEFISRIGELADGEVIAEPFKALEEIERLFREAKKFVWVLTDRHFAPLERVMVGRPNSSFDLRTIFPEGAYLPDSRAVIPSTAPGVQKRVLSRVDIRVVVTEKGAGFSLPLRSSKLNYGAFQGEAPKFHKWCQDLFLYYWEKAKPFTSENV